MGWVSGKDPAIRSVREQQDPAESGGAAIGMLGGIRAGESDFPGIMPCAQQTRLARVLQAPLNSKFQSLWSRG